MLTHEDKELLAKKGISEEQIAEQLACFEKDSLFAISCCCIGRQ